MYSNSSQDSYQDDNQDVYFPPVFEPLALRLKFNFYFSQEFKTALFTKFGTRYPSFQDLTQTFTPTFTIDVKNRQDLIAFGVEERWRLANNRNSHSLFHNFDFRSDIIKESFYYADFIGDVWPKYPNSVLNILLEPSVFELNAYVSFKQELFTMYLKENARQISQAEKDQRRQDSLEREAAKSQDQKERDKKARQESAKRGVETRAKNKELNTTVKTKREKQPALITVLTKDQAENRAKALEERSETRAEQTLANILDENYIPKPVVKKPKLKPKIRKTEHEVIIEKPSQEELDFTANYPYRSKNKIQALMSNTFNRTLATKDIEVTKLNNFSLKHQVKTYQLKTYANKNTYIGDIMFSSTSAFLILINTNTRKTYAKQLGEITVKEVVNVGIVMSIPTNGVKTTRSLVLAFNALLDVFKIDYLRFDGERGINTSAFKLYLKENGITFIPVMKDQHTSLGLIDRVIRTIRDIAFNLNISINTQDQIDYILSIYNKTPHKTLTEVLTRAEPSLRTKFRYGICPNDMSNDTSNELEALYVRECIKHNSGKLADENFSLKPGQKVRIYNPKGTFNKNRSILTKNIYTIVEKVGNVYLVQSGDSKLYVPRYYIKSLE